MRQIKTIIDGTPGLRAQVNAAIQEIGSEHLRDPHHDEYPTEPDRLNGGFVAISSMILETGREEV
jgi:hypothetical protein